VIYSTMKSSPRVALIWDDIHRSLNGRPRNALTGLHDTIGGHTRRSLRRLVDSGILLARAQGFVLTLELTHPSPLVGRESGPATLIDLSSADPHPQRLVVHASFSAIDAIAFHCDGYSCACSNTIQTARSRSSSGYLLPLPTPDIGPSSQGKGQSPDQVRGIF
jgi:hypothetical protein